MTEIAIDPETGMPELPEGWFWRVCAANNWANDMWSFPDFRVSIIRKRRFWFDEYIRGEWLGERTDLTEDNVRQKAIGMMRRRAEDVAKQKRRALILGDYPPKKIGGE